MTRRQSLKQALRLASRGERPYSLCATALDGCPVGGWPETQQAMRLIADELPAARSYTVADFVSAAYTVDHADRYRRVAS